MTRPAHCTCPAHETGRRLIGARRYRIEYRPLDGWAITGEPLTDNRLQTPRGPWPTIGTRITREDAERDVALWQGRQLLLLDIDLNDPAPSLARTA